MTMDLNKGITDISYDNAGNLRKITFSGDREIRYVYASDGTRLRAVHSYKKDNALITDSTDYAGNLVIRNGKPHMYMFPGGYYSFDGGRLGGCHYYIKDYLGSNRMVVGENGKTEQVTHYYPYGGIIGGIDQSPDAQIYKYEGKELDRTFGLDWYDIHARQYDSVIPSWHAVDPMCEKYYWLSPYTFCGNNPINKMDINGMDDWYISHMGYVKRKPNKNADYVYFLNNEFERIPTTLTFEYGTLDGYNINNGNNYVFSVKGKQHTKTLFEYLANNTEVEWSEALVENNSEMRINNYIVTSHDIKKEKGMNVLINDKLKYLCEYFVEFNHSHPIGGDDYPSGLEPNDKGKYEGDIGFAKGVSYIFGPKVKFNIYSLNLNQYISFGPNSTKNDYLITFPLEEVIIKP